MGDGLIRKPRAYSADDVAIVLRRGNWRSWEEAIHWLQGPGMIDAELPPAEGRHIADDFLSLVEAGLDYTNDPQQAFSLAQQGCKHC